MKPPSTKLTELLDQPRNRWYHYVIRVFILPGIVLIFAVNFVWVLLATCYCYLRYGGETIIHAHSQRSEFRNIANIMLMLKELLNSQLPAHKSPTAKSSTHE